MFFVVVVYFAFLCLQENARVAALYEGKLKILEAREYALLYQERDVLAKEEELIRREESLRVRERDYNQLCEDLEAECWRFRRDFRFQHKVIVVWFFVFFMLVSRFVICLVGIWTRILMLGTICLGICETLLILMLATK